MYLQMKIYSIEHEITLNKEGKTLVRYRQSREIIYQKSSHQKWLFRTDSKTLIINPTKRADTGVYTVSIYDKNTGKLLESTTVVVIIEGKKKKKTGVLY